MSAAFHVDRWDQIPAAINRLQTGGAGFRVPPLQALYRGEIAYLEIGRDASAGLFKRWAAAIQLPDLALIGDDDQAALEGPDTWPIARRALQWTRFAIIHGARGEVAHYELAVDLAKRHRRAVIIECSSAALPAWERAASKWCTSGAQLVLRPKPGVSHPAPIAAGASH